MIGLTRSRGATECKSRPRVRWILATLTVVASLSVAGCNRGSSSGAAETEVRVAFVQAHMTSTFRTQMIEGAQEAADRLGVKLTVFNSNNEVIKQNDAIASYATQGVDIIAVAAIELESVLPAVRAAANQGVKIIAVDTVIKDDSISAQIGVDNASGGKTMGEFVMKYAKDNDVKAQVGIVGALNSEIQNTRKDSFASVVNAGGGNIVGTVDGQNRQEVALASAENLLTSYKDLPIMYATGEPALVGALSASRSQGLQDKVKIFGWDLSQETVAAIDTGQVIGVAYQPAKQEGIATIETAVKINKGAAFEKNQSVPIEIVTKKNLDDYRSIFK